MICVSVHKPLYTLEIRGTTRYAVAARANYACTSYSTFIASEFLRREYSFIHSLKTNKVKRGPISSHITNQFPKKNVHSHLSIYSKLLKYTYYLIIININQSNLKSQISIQISIIPSPQTSQNSTQTPSPAFSHNTSISPFRPDYAACHAEYP